MASSKKEKVLFLISFLSWYKSEKSHGLGVNIMNLFGLGIGSQKGNIDIISKEIADPQMNSWVLLIPKRPVREKH